MYKHILSILGLAAMLMLFAGCEENEIPPIGDVPSKLEGIDDTFKLIGVQRTDKLACVNRPTTLDVTSFFIRQDAPTISFDSNAKTFSYSVGDAPVFLPESGSWRFINENYPDQANEYPEQIGFTPDGGQEIVLDLLKPIRPSDPTLEIELTKMSDDKPAQGYIFIFERM